MRLARLPELIGKRFGHLTVLQRNVLGAPGRERAQYVCQCDCGKLTLVWATNLRGARAGHTTSCGCQKFAHAASGDKHWNWKGGRHLDGHGYAVVLAPNHPNADKRGLVKEHIAVMAEMIGRPLLPGENVHHRNGQRADNRPENLELWTTMQPSGKRPPDLIRFAKEVFARYGSDELVYDMPLFSKVT